MNLFEPDIPFGHLLDIAIPHGVIDNRHDATGKDHRIATTPGHFIGNRE